MMKEQFLQDVLLRLRKVLPNSGATFALHEPTMGGNEWTYVKECLDTGWVSSVGSFVDRFAVLLASYTGTKFAIPTVNGTAALHICLQIVDVQPGDEVLVPAITFIATANAVSYCGAIPHLVDCSEHTLGIDPDKLNSYLSQISSITSTGCFNRNTGRRIKAIVPMHALGHPVDLDPLLEVCQRYKLEIVEDASESLGSFYKGRHTGSFGKVSALSFNGNKTITTGGGGAVLTNDESLANMAKHLTTVAKLPHPWRFVHDQVGYNYRLPNLNAALGVAQLEQLPQLLRQKRQLAHSYQQAFQGAKDIQVLIEPTFAKSNYWLNALILTDASSLYLEDLLHLTNSEGMMTRPLWMPLHQQVMYKNSPRMDLTTTESLARRVINIPSSAFLGGDNG
jgi:perosamine synthetase